MMRKRGRWSAQLVVGCATLSCSKVAGVGVAGGELSAVRFASMPHPRLCAQGVSDTYGER